jgi:hypothetical protein
LKLEMYATSWFAPSCSLHKFKEDGCGISITLTGERPSGLIWPTDRCLRLLKEAI